MLNAPKLSNITKEKIEITEFSGLDTRKFPANNTLSAEKNISSLAYPRLATRLGRKKIFSPARDEKITGVEIFNKAYVTTSLDGITRLYVGDNLYSLEYAFSANISETESSLTAWFNNEICIFNVCDYSLGTSILAARLRTFDRPSRYSAPEFTDVTVYKNRVLGCRLKQIHACAEQNVVDWDDDNELVPENQRSFLKNYQINTDFTACTTFKNRAIFFSQDQMFEFYGENSKYFNLVKIAEVGCVNRNSVCEAGGKLYFVSHDGVMCYNGSTVKKISAPVDCIPTELNRVSFCAMGASLEELCVCCTPRVEKNIFVYDIQNKVWSQEDNFPAVSIIGKYGRRYIATEDGIYECGFDKEGDYDSFKWEAVTSPIYSHTSTSKRNIEIEIFLEQKASARIDVHAKFDDRDFEPIHSAAFTGAGKITIPVRDRSFSKLQLKIGGTGVATVHSASVVYISGGNKNG